MKRTATVLSTLALSVAVLGGTAAASDDDLFSETGDQSTSRECNEHDSLGLTLLGIPLLGFFFPDQC
ncbi:hypothetical protein C9J60_09760 [Streptomyces sp. A244]|nr:hypothetical protein C9J60_09760 [Streptomyces sp. A244]